MFVNMLFPGKISSCGGILFNAPFHTSLKMLYSLSLYSPNISVINFTATKHPLSTGCISIMAKICPGLCFGCSRLKSYEEAVSTVRFAHLLWTMDMCNRDFSTHPCSEFYINTLPLMMFQGPSLVERRTDRRMYATPIQVSWKINK